MLKNQTVNHVSEHLSAICPVYTPSRGRRLADGRSLRFYRLTRVKDPHPNPLPGEGLVATYANVLLAKWRD